MNFFPKTSGLKKYFSKEWNFPFDLIDFTFEQESVDLKKQNAIGIKEHFTIGEMIEQAVSTEVNHYVSVPSDFLEYELNFIDKIFKSGNDFFLKPEKLILDSDTVDWTIRLEFEKLDQKEVFLAELNHALSAVSGSKTVQEAVVLCAEEFFTNATIHALPHAENALQKKGVMFLLQDEHFLSLVCVDAIGKVNIDSILIQLKKCHQLGVTKAIRQNQRGAGIGLYLAIESSVSFFIGANPGKNTVMACRFPLHMSNRQVVSIPKSLHLFR